MEHGESRYTLIGTSPAFAQLVTAIEHVAGRSEPILLIGESGTRKELLARTIHERSPRHARPFVTMHCGSTAPAMMEFEFFGFDKGAFSGADASTPGLVERVDGGTLFIDELDMLDPVLQLWLVHVLHTGRVTRIGRAKPFRVDMRIVSATNQDLAQMCGAGMFRNDLRSLLSAVTVRVPPLRERGGEDIELLARHYLETAASKTEQGVSGFSDEAMRALVTYAWPGNEQELEHVVEHTLVGMRPGALIALSDLPPTLQPNS